jgi:signal transduction histidine kinase
MVEARTAELRETITHLESFSYTVAHDLRAPIRAMEGYSRVLLEDYDAQLDKVAKELIGNIGRAARSLDSLTRDVLNYTKLSTLKVELASIDLAEIVQDVLALNPALQPPHATIALVRPLHAVLGHRTLLIQCISNLLDNAVKFVRPEVPPRVIIRSETVASKAGASPMVRIWIEDNGIGIDKHAQEKIFGIFERARGMNQYAGTGVGLAIVAKAVQRMGGSHGVESEVGAGSRFWVQLPAAEP